jgi:hypothetical protein
MKTITWEQIDKALLFYTRVWTIVEKHSDSIIMYPFYDFERVSGELNCLFSKEQTCNAKKAWKEYIIKIKDARDLPWGRN